MVRLPWQRIVLVNLVDSSFSSLAFVPRTVCIYCATPSTPYRPPLRISIGCVTQSSILRFVFYCFVLLLPFQTIKLRHGVSVEKSFHLNCALSALGYGRLPSLLSSRIRSPCFYDTGLEGPQFWKAFWLGASAGLCSMADGDNLQVTLHCRMQPSRWPWPVTSRRLAGTHVQTLCCTNTSMRLTCTTPPMQRPPTFSTNLCPRGISKVESACRKSLKMYLFHQ